MEFIKKYFKHFCFAFIVLIGLSAVIFNPVSRLDANTDEGRIKFIEKYGWKVEKTPYLCEKVQIPVKIVFCTFRRARDTALARFVSSHGVTCQ